MRPQSSARRPLQGSSTAGLAFCVVHWDAYNNNTFTAILGIANSPQRCSPQSQRKASLSTDPPALTVPAAAFRRLLLLLGITESHGALHASCTWLHPSCVCWCISGAAARLRQYVTPRLHRAGWLPACLPACLYGESIGDERLPGHAVLSPIPLVAQTCSRMPCFFCGRCDAPKARPDVSSSSLGCLDSPCLMASTPHPVCPVGRLLAVPCTVLVYIIDGRSISLINKLGRRPTAWHGPCFASKSSPDRWHQPPMPDSSVYRRRSSLALGVSCESAQDGL